MDNIRDQFERSNMSKTETEWDTRRSKAQARIERALMIISIAKMELAEARATLMEMT